MLELARKPIRPKPENVCAMMPEPAFKELVEECFPGARIRLMEDGYFEILIENGSSDLPEATLGDKDAAS